MSIAWTTKIEPDRAGSSSLSKAWREGEQVAISWNRMTRATLMVGLRGLGVFEAILDRLEIKLVVL